MAGASESGIAPSAFVPATYFIQPLNDQWAWGIGLFSNYGLSTEYTENFNGGSIAGNTELLTFNINPNIAYRVNQHFSVGAGLNLVYAKAELNRRAGVLAAVPPLSSVPGIGKDTIVSHLKGDDWGYGWNVGTMYEVNENNRFALTYRSQVDLKFKGDYQGTSSGFKTVGGELPLDLPAQAEFAGYHRLNQQFAVHYSVNWTDWAPSRSSRPPAVSATAPTVPASASTSRRSSGLHPLLSGWYLVRQPVLGSSYRLPTTIPRSSRNTAA